MLLPIGSWLRSWFSTVNANILSQRQSELPYIGPHCVHGSQFKAILGWLGNFRYILIFITKLKTLAVCSATSDQHVYYLSALSTKTTKPPWLNEMEFSLVIFNLVNTGEANSYCMYIPKKNFQCYLMQKQHFFLLYGFILYMPWRLFWNHIDWVVFKY